MSLRRVHGPAPHRCRPPWLFPWTKAAPGDEWDCPICGAGYRLGIDFLDLTREWERR